MTVVVAFYCTDGVVIAADSMITPSMGNINVGHHHGQKIQILSDSLISAFAGDQGQGARFSLLAQGVYPMIAQTGRPIDYPIALTAAVLGEFEVTRILGSISVNTVLAYSHGTEHQCCVFEGPLQPRLLDRSHFYVALGSGKLCADPFLRFLSDTFCQDGLPTVREAIFLSTWVVQYVIETNPGGVADPIRISILERNAANALVGRELGEGEITQHKEAVESAKKALKDWRIGIQTGAAADDVPAPPNAPTA
jgi:hypothetical protein